MEKIYQVYGDNGKNLTEEENPEILVENNLPTENETLNLQWEEYMHPNFPWENRKLWINNPKAVNYWLSTKKGTVRALSQIRNEEDNIKIY